MSGGDRVAQLFAQAEARRGADRDAFLAGVRDEDAPLADELASLLAANAGAAGLLDESPWRAFGDIDELVDAAPAAVGPYRIVRQIGRGGMGRVYLAEQRTADFRRPVALKLIDRPLDGPTLRRFRDEVRILAALEHPGIARFLDGGRSPEGTWFLAVEYVEGEDLLAHARRRELCVDERVRLFLAVLEAVAYAHSRGVVHRDLKPGNILVGADGRPRLLDFGISKLVDAGDDGEAAATRTELRAFTPAYASPEQFRGERASPAADVYSLGVVLYELLAGVRPYGTAESRAELERAVLDREPEPPSTAARRGSSAASGSRPDDAGGGEAQRGRLGRDLDAVCLKALRKASADRYASVAAFADDLRRYLEGGAVEARRGGLRYRTSRFVRRHRARLGTAAASLFGVAALLVALAMQQRAERAAHPTDPPPRPFPFSSGTAAPIEELKRRFDQAPASVEAGAVLALALEREGRKKEAGLVLTRLRQIPGKSLDPFTDYVDAVFSVEAHQPQRALVLHTRALHSAIASGRGELVGQIRAARGRVLSTLGRRDEARREMQAARAAFAAAGDQASLARVFNDLAIEVLQTGEVDEAERMFEAALVATRAVSPKNSGATFLRNLGLIAMLRGRPDLAEPRFRETVEVFRRLDRPGRLAGSLGTLSLALRDLGRPAEARRALDEALAIARKAGEAGVLGPALAARGDAQLDAGRLAGIDAIADEIDATAQASANQLDLGLAETLRGRLAALRGDEATARRHLDEAHRLIADGGDRDVEKTVELLRARFEREAGKPAEASRFAAAAAASWHGRGENAAVAMAQSLLAAIDAAAGRTAEARQRLASLPIGADHSPSVSVRIAFLGARAEVLAAEGRSAEARRDFESAIATARAAERTVDELHLRLVLAELDRRSGDAGRAERAIADVDAEAARLGLRAISARARRLAADQSPTARTAA
ncbi:MAG TPA: serine/threonine-protein kinase [Thermoanaerobaculia bacterium]|jgi:serine/threonine-protein kinase|nr:serine/threonine-protein kinase [Thermoanaerobaculia bacterium]